MFGNISMMEDQVVSLSLAQVAEIQDELYTILEAVRKDPVLSARVSRIIKTFETRSKQSSYTQDIDEDYSHMLGLSTLIAQAQQQCQQ